MNYRVLVVMGFGLAICSITFDRLAAAEPETRPIVVVQNDSMTIRWGATDRDMLVLDEHPDLKTLIIGGGEAWDGPDPGKFPFEITDAGFAHVANCRKLQTLDLSSSHPLRVTDDGLKVLRELKSLRHVNLGMQPFSDAAITHLAELTTIEELWLDGNENLGDGTLRSISNLKKLRVLRFYRAPITDAGIASIRGLTELQDLQLGHAKIGDRSLEIIGDFKKLRTLDLQHTLVTDAGMPHLSGLNLDWLCLHDTAVTGRGLAALAKMTELKWLILDGTKVDDDALLHLANLKKLEYLYLSRTRVTDAGVMKLKMLSQLISLKLDRLPITDSSIPTLLALKNLKTIEMNGTDVTAAGFARLSQADIERINVAP